MNIRNGPMTTLPAGWSIEVLDQGSAIGEVWMRLQGPNPVQRATKVYDRDSSMGTMLVELALAQ